MKRRVQKYAKLFAIASGLGVVVLVFVFLRALGSIIEPVNNPAEYPKVYARLAEHGVFKVCPAIADWLPTTLPRSATNVSMLYQPGALQGGDVLFVTYRLPAAEFASVKDRIDSASVFVRKPAPGQTELAYELRQGTPGVAPKDRHENGFLFEIRLDPTACSVGYAMTEIKY